MSGEIKELVKWEEDGVLHVYISYDDGTKQQEHFDKKTGSYGLLCTDEDGDIISGAGGSLPPHVWSIIAEGTGLDKSSHPDMKKCQSLEELARLTKNRLPDCENHE